MHIAHWQGASYKSTFVSKTWDLQVSTFAGLRSSKMSWPPKRTFLLNATDEKDLPRLKLLNNRSSKVWPYPPKRSDAMNTQLMTWGFRVKMKGPPTWDEDWPGYQVRTLCNVSMAIPVDSAPSVELSFVHYCLCQFVTPALAEGSTLDYIPCSFLEIQLSHAMWQTLVQEDSKMAEFIHRMSQVSLRKTWVDNLLLQLSENGTRPREL